MLSKALALVLLLSACTPPVFDLASEPGEFKPPISKERYIFTAYGFYLDKDSEFGDEISYTALYDNRRTKQGLMQAYEPTESFRKNYPDFIRHKGVTDCGSNKATVEYLDQDLKKTFVRDVSTPTEVSIALCTLRRLAE